MNQSNGQDLNGVRPEGDPSVQGIDSSSHVMLDAGRTEGDHRSKQRVSKVGRIRFDFTEGARPAYVDLSRPYVSDSFFPAYSTLSTIYCKRLPVSNYRILTDEEWELLAAQLMSYHRRLTIDAVLVDGAEVMVSEWRRRKRSNLPYPEINNDFYKDLKKVLPPGGSGGPTARGPSHNSGEPARGRPDKRRWLSHACYRLLAWLRQFYIWLTA